MTGLRVGGWLAACVCCMTGCQIAPQGGSLTGDAGTSPPVDSSLPPPTSTTWFQEVTATSGITAVHKPSSSGDILYPLRASGIAVGDIDGDGKPDIVAPTGFGPTYVYRNEGGLRFADVTTASGVDGRNVSSSATLCDLDGDGKLDLLLGTDDDQTDSDVRYYHGNGNATFTDQTSAAGFAVHGGVRTILCTDLDGDGLLDVYVADFGFEVTLVAPGRADAFYRNQGDGTFVDIAARLGFDALGYTWTAAANDFNADGRPDLYVGNDTFINDFGVRPVPPGATTSTWTRTCSTSTTVPAATATRPFTLWAVVPPPSPQASTAAYPPTPTSGTPTSPTPAPTPSLPQMLRPTPTPTPSSASCAPTWASSPPTSRATASPTSSSRTSAARPCSRAPTPASSPTRPPLSASRPRCDPTSPAPPARCWSNACT